MVSRLKRNHFRQHRIRHSNMRHTCKHITKSPLNMKNDPQSDLEPSYQWHDRREVKMCPIPSAHTQNGAEPPALLPHAESQLPFMFMCGTFFNTSVMSGWLCLSPWTRVLKTFCHGYDKLCSFEPHCLSCQNCFGFCQTHWWREET